MMIEIINNFIFLCGFIIGLGAVTVIDLLGFFGQNSSYWTQTTIRAHKVTKPLIWLGLLFLLIGEALAYARSIESVFINLFSIILVPMVLNGVFLSFYVSPKLLELEKIKKDSELLPTSLKNMILVSFVISFACWWGSVFLFALHISQ